ncbi:ScbA/BarX family gamma-butyrolactone biosynthesis protein [Streptomyces rubradiris]|uniref:Adhesin n=1 Tax=Streptomyces rubradiris TaxID=285531 RepID=A0ABQ3REX1_STRRR|nr:ScbA/BarX family gamma-butyrolactone biosynthesis protein [Streptomyces rubradiris]GHG97742.1 adhesin [Streptomyces rubradiris]GHI54398.1 adhesin [Streptomyces rubradiris]
MTTFAPIDSMITDFQAALPTTPVGLTTLTTTVPKEYVHRSVVTEVFLTGWRQTDADTCTVTAQWPRAHTFYGPAEGFHDPLLFSETLRQTVPLLSHAVFGAPMDHKQIWRDLHVALDPAALRAGLTPADVELSIRCSDVERRAGVLRGMRMEVTATREGQRLGTASTSFSSHSRALYQRLRGAYADAEQAMAAAVELPPSLQPGLVGRDRPHDVVLSPRAADGRWQLRVNTLHPIIFDHPNDHAPGMLLLEAARQAAQHHLGPEPVLATGLDAAFHRYAELDAPAWVAAETAADGRVRVTVEQHDALAFECAVTTHPATA